jgi:hypothetical protein
MCLPLLNSHWIKQSIPSRPVLAFTMDLLVLGLATPVIVDVKGTMRVFEQLFALENTIGSHACSLEALARV